MIMAAKINTELFEKSLREYLNKVEIDLSDRHGETISLADYTAVNDPGTTAIESMSIKIMMILEDCLFDD